MPMYLGQHWNLEGNGIFLIKLLIFDSDAINVKHFKCKKKKKINRKK
jgi:hypothetical protein